MIRGDYAVASLCFRKAAQSFKAKITKIHLKEVKKIELKANEENTALKMKFEKIVATFQKMRLAFDATRFLIRLDKLDDVVEL